MVIKCDFPECDKKAWFKMDVFSIKTGERVKSFELCDEHEAMTLVNLV